MTTPVGRMESANRTSVIPTVIPSRPLRAARDSMWAVTAPSLPEARARATTTSPTSPTAARTDAAAIGSTPAAMMGLVMSAASAALKPPVSPNAIPGPRPPRTSSHGAVGSVSRYTIAIHTPTHNPALATRVDFTTQKRKEDPLGLARDIPLPAEIAVILAAAPPRWRRLLLTAAYTGMRAGELRGLQ